MGSTRGEHREWERVAQRVLRLGDADQEFGESVLDKPVKLAACGWLDVDATERAVVSKLGIMQCEMSGDVNALNHDAEQSHEQEAIKHLEIAVLDTVTCDHDGQGSTSKG